MRLILLTLSLTTLISLNTQAQIPLRGMSYFPWQPYYGHYSYNDSISSNRRWFVSKYAGLSTGIGFVNGQSFTTFAVPVGLQFNQPLNNNFVAFAGVSVAPTFFSASQPFLGPTLTNSYPGGTFPNAYGFGVNSRIEMGLMYINDAKTFSISGSIGVERSSFPVYPYDRGNSKNSK